MKLIYFFYELVSHFIIILFRHVFIFIKIMTSFMILMSVFCNNVLQFIKLGFEYLLLIIFLYVFHFLNFVNDITQKSRSFELSIWIQFLSFLFLLWYYLFIPLITIILLVGVLWEKISLSLLRTFINRIFIS